MIEVREIFEPEEKTGICDAILRALPDWFGIESAIVSYVDESRRMPFYAAFEQDTEIGFVAVKVHNIHTAEVYVMGLRQDFHRHGIGRKLITACEQYCIRNKMEFLTVKTLDGSRTDENYAKTRLFYQSVGFKPLEVFPLLWGKENPCLYMAKYIEREV